MYVRGKIAAYTQSTIGYRQGAEGYSCCWLWNGSATEHQTQLSRLNLQMGDPGGKLSKVAPQPGVSSKETTERNRARSA